jgi:hypothetical protein
MKRRTVEKEEKGKKNNRRYIEQERINDRQKEDGVREGNIGKS